MDPIITRTSFGPQRTSIVQSAVLEANRGQQASLSSMGLPKSFTPDPARIESDLAKLKGKLGVSRGTSNPGGLVGRMYKTLYPEKHAKLTESVLSHNKGMLRQQMQGAGILGDKAALAGASKAFTETLKSGRGRFGLSMGTRLIGSVNYSAMKMTGKGAMMGLGVANVASKAVLGASLGQVGFAAAAVAGLGYMAGSALGITGSQAASAASAVHQTFKAMNRPAYGHSELGQSVNGLTFGLHNKRRG